MTPSRRLPVALACLSLLTLVILAACNGRDDEPVQPVAFHPTSPTPKPKATPSTVMPDDQPAANSTPPPEKRSEPAPAHPDTAPQTVDYPYGVPVEGKPGYVKSPYAPDSGYVDVRQFTPGQQARDPFTNKIFLVP